MEFTNADFKETIDLAARLTNKLKAGEKLLLDFCAGPCHSILNLRGYQKHSDDLKFSNEQYY